MNLLTKQKQTQRTNLLLPGRKGGVEKGYVGSWRSTCIHCYICTSFWEKISRKLRKKKSDKPNEPSALSI